MPERVAHTVKVLVVSSTLPATETDATPAFVRDQLIALKKRYTQLDISVLAPHHGTETADLSRHPHFDEYRFAYAKPRRWQRLAGQGILPSLQANPALALLVLPLFVCEFWALWRLVRRLRPDVIYAHWFTPQGVTAALVSKMTGVPFVLTSHANDVRIWALVPIIGRAVVRLLLPMAARITAVSTPTYERMLGFFSPDERTHLSRKTAIIPMGVDTAQFAPVPAARRRDLKRKYGYGDYFVVYFVGRLASKKGLTYLIDAVAELKGRGVKLVVAGDGPRRAGIELHVANRNATEAVDFVGFVSGQTKLDYLHLCDVVVVPSIETTSGDVEGFPVVIMEAMAAGKICIASDRSGGEMVIVSGQNGIIVPQKSAGALSRAIIDVMSMEGDVSRKIAERASSTAVSWDWTEIARRYGEFLFSEQRLEGGNEKTGSP